MSNRKRNAAAPELYPGQHRDLRRVAERKENADRAQAAILPGPLRAAFAGDPVKVAGHTLQPVSLGLTANLERIQSPLLAVLRIMREEMMRGREDEDQEPKAKSPDAKVDTAKRLAKAHKRIQSEIKSDIVAQVETAFLFITPQADVRKLLDSGRDKFREHVMIELGDKLHPAVLGELMRACAAHYAASFDTVIVYGSPPDRDGTVFTAPPPGAKMVSAGGSTSSER